MKKSVVNVMLGLAIIGISSSPVLAQEHIAKFNILCPASGTDATNQIENYGHFIAGSGALSMNNDIASQPLFEGQIIPGAKIPGVIANGGYNNSGVYYNSSNGAVTCFYKSINGFDPFSVSFVFKNALDGFVYFSSKKEVRIKVSMGND